MLDTLQEMSDEKLMELYQIGDLYAFNVIYQRYEHKIYGYFHRFFPEERCADLLQETFLKVHRSRSRYKASLPFSKWLFVIACNLAKDEFKRLSRLKEYLDDEQLENKQTFLVDPETPESIVEHDELWERIRQAILDLPENDREAIIQSKYEGKSYPEIAESMDITVGAVKQRVSRGLLTLREKLKDLVEPELKVKAKKGFSGIMILKFQGIIKKLLMGGLEAMKISAKVKILAIGVAAVLMLGGMGVMVWHYHQSAQETLMSSVSQAEQQKNLAPLNKNLLITNSIVNENVNKSTEKQENVRDAKITDQKSLLIAGTGQGIEQAEAKTVETPLKKYQRIWYSPEFQAEFENATAPYETEYERLKKEAVELLQKKNNLENDMASASGENRDKIQKELGKVETDYKESRMQACTSFSMMIFQSDRVTLKYFTSEEYHEALFQMTESGGMPTPPPLPTKEEGEASGNLVFSQEEWSEAERRLNAKGINTRIFSPPSQALLDKYVYLRN
jgi:RNA polymerase sigma-70 factor, ECF subfamily